MSLKKPVIILSSPTTVTSLHCYQTCQLPLSQCHTNVRARKIRRIQCSDYVTTSNGAASSSISEFSWPQTDNPSHIPNPYQIFNQKRGDPYSKARFFELVKIYHPDRLKFSGKISPERKAIMSERYRLIIAANTVLADPKKRQAYDQTGQGWFRSDRADRTESTHYKYSTYHRWYKDGSRASNFTIDEDPMMNANWEDWERWYRNQYYRASGTSPPHWSSKFFSARRQQNTVFSNNYAFVSLVFLLAALGGVGQATRAHETSKSRLQNTQLVSEETSKLLMTARHESLEYSNSGETKQDRIKRFLRDKEHYDEDEFDARAARPDGIDDSICASSSVKDRDDRRYWEKPPPH